MLKPKFPYLNNQIIISSNRVLLHSKTDAIFLFGKAAVGLSSPATINLDSNEKILINAPKIELGKQAESKGEPVVLGKKLTKNLRLLLGELRNAGMLLSQVSTSDLGSSMQAIASAGGMISKVSSDLLNILSEVPEANPILSKTTFTT